MKRLSIASFVLLLSIAVSLQLFYSSCKKDVCETLKCWNGGTCVDGACICAAGWEGDICTTPVVNADPCLNVDCQNGGTCVDGTCNCASGYEGTNCETEMRSKFVRTWAANDNCSLSGASSYSLIVTNGSNINLITIANFNNEFTTVNATVSGNNITIPNQFQTSGLTTYSINGSGIFNNNSVSLSYTIINTSTFDTNTCTATWQ